MQIDLPWRPSRLLSVPAQVVTWCLLSCVHVPLASSQVVSDLQLELAVVPSRPVYQVGDFLRVHLTVTNQGPDALPRSQVVMREFEFGGPTGSQVWIGPIPETAPCSYSMVDLSPPPGGPGYITPLVEFPPLPSGSALTCTVGLLVVYGATGSYLVGGQVYPFLQGAVDPNPANNIASRRIFFRGPLQSPSVIPTLGWFGLAILSLVIAIAARYQRNAL
jgi:hypothetical protein